MVHGPPIEVLGMGSPEKLRSDEGVEQFLANVVEALS
jgi:hypothetical protein